MSVESTPESAAQGRVEQALAHMNAGAWPEAVADLEAVLAEAPRDATALRLLGTVHYVNGRLEPAAHLLEESLEADPSALSGWLNLTSIHLAAGQPERAVEAAERAVALDERSTDALFNLGVALQQVDRVEDASAVYERVLAIDPTSADARMNLAALALGRGEMHEAATLAEQVLEAAPDLLQARLCAARALVTIGDSDRAALHLAAAESLAPGTPEVVRVRLSWLIALGRLPEAEVLARQVLAALPEESWPYMMLGEVLMQTGRHEEAAPLLGEALVSFPDALDLALALAGALRATERADEACEVLVEAAANGPDNPAVQLALGECLAGLGRLDEADAALRRSVELAPTIVLAHDRRVRVALARGAPHEALAICEHYLAHHPTERTLVAAKAMVLHEIGEDERARELLGLEALPSIERIDPPPGYESVAAFNRALEAHVRAHPSLVESPGGHATRNGQHTGNLLAGERGPFEAFESLLWRAVERFLARGGDHPYLTHVPEFERIVSWAVLMRSGGHQTPHIHPAAWLSGVYYARVPPSVLAEGNAEGWLEFGEPPRDTYTLTREQWHRLVRPEEGLLVLFPSFLYHRTVPFAADEQRLSIAFDVLPRVSMAMA